MLPEPWDQLQPTTAGEAQASDRQRHMEPRAELPAESGLSAASLAYSLCKSDRPGACIAAVLADARRHWDGHGTASAAEVFVFPQVVHSLGTAVLRQARDHAVPLNESFPGLCEALNSAEFRWLETAALKPATKASVQQWASQLHSAAFAYLRSRIVASGQTATERPVNTLRSDEIVWGRAPARLDLAGGWTDTPPFALEHGGRVLNAAVQLNGQPPIHAYARVTSDLAIRCRSIDRGTQEDIRGWDELLNYADAAGEFSLVKAALAVSGFAPADAGASPVRSLAETLEHFGGGLELTTLAAIPKGSGLGTSSIMGAVLLATIHRVLGRQPSQNELFHAVLRLEQVMTTGGGWQDQVGGVVGGLKLVTTQPGLVPDPTICYVVSDVLAPGRNGGQTLLYYTGITRLAKNILQQVVGRWLDRDREAVETLQEIGRLASDMSEAVARRDLPEFGRLIDVAWQLNKRLDPNSTTEDLDALLDRLKPHIYGAKLLGAGGGGFLFLVAKSPADAARVRDLLDTGPPNPRARFFDFELSDQGLAVSVC